MLLLLLLLRAVFQGFAGTVRVASLALWLSLCEDRGREGGREGKGGREGREGGRESEAGRRRAGLQGDI